MKLVDLTEEMARLIVEGAHRAWTQKDLDSMLSWYVDDLTYLCNVGGRDGGPLFLTGKEELRDFLLPVTEVADATSTLLEFRFQDGVGRARIDSELRHRKTGVVLKGTYRQVLTFANDKIAKLEEFHDAARMRAFWNLVSSVNPDPG